MGTDRRRTHVDARPVRGLPRSSSPLRSSSSEPTGPRVDCRWPTSTGPRVSPNASSAAWVPASSAAAATRQRGRRRTSRRAARTTRQRCCPICSAAPASMWSTSGPTRQPSPWSTLRNARRGSLRGGVGDDVIRKRALAPSVGPCVAACRCRSSAARRGSRDSRRSDHDRPGCRRLDRCRRRSCDHRALEDHDCCRRLATSSRPSASIGTRPSRGGSGSQKVPRRKRNTDGTAMSLGMPAATRPAITAASERADAARRGRARSRWRCR